VAAAGVRAAHHRPQRGRPTPPTPTTTPREKTANEHSKIYEKMQMNTPKFIEKNAN
jgi:hypothetical protein